jgi:ATP-dependent RNA helicase RhlE
MRFNQYPFSPEIKRSLEEVGFKKPTDIQFKSIPPILAREDVLAIAQTGTGKTAAFAIPVLHLLHEQNKNPRRRGIRCVVMVPTHELAQQIAGVFQELGKYTALTTYALFGGTDQAPQIAQLKKGVDILVSTPGRLFDLRSQGFLSIDDVELLILDEADHMLDLGFIKDIEDIIKRIPKKRQTLFFSATINDKIKKLAYSVVSKAVRIQISPKDPVSKNITHSVAFIEMDDKRFFLERVLGENPDAKLLVFVRTKVRAERVAAAMERVGVVSMTIHSDKTQDERNEVMEKFRSGEVKLLIATDVSARGIDIPNVDIVVNYDLPDVAENYVHRVGRTGRGVQKGRAVAFCSKEERIYLHDIEAYLGGSITVLEIDGAAYEETKVLSDDLAISWKDIQHEIDMAEQFKKKTKKKKK